MGRNWPGILIILLYLTASFIYNVTVPLWETPDEVGHFGYIIHIVQHRSLPRMEIGHLGEAHQPPLYYLLGALLVAPVNLDDPTGAWHPNPRFIWGGGGNEPNIGLHNPDESRFPYRGWALGLHLVRLFSSLLGAGTIWFIYRIARQIFPSQMALPALAAAAIAFNPQFLFITASANNDNLLAFMTTGLLWHTMDLQERIVQRNPVSLLRWAGLGGWVWAIVMTKWTGLAVVGITFLALLIAGWRSRQTSEVVRGLAVALILVAAGTLWWWLRNWRLYDDPLGWKVYRQVFAVNLRSTPLTLSDLQAMLQTQYRSFWGVFGWMTVNAPAWFYRTTLWMGALALLGWIIQIPWKLRSYNRGGLLFLVFAALAQEGFLISIAQHSNESMWQGRYLFPVVAPIATILAGGWVGWAPRRIQGFLAALIGVAELGIALFLPLVVIRNAYAPLLNPNQITIPNPVRFQFGDQFLLPDHSCSLLGSPAFS